MRLQRHWAHAAVVGMRFLLIDFSGRYMDGQLSDWSPRSRRMVGNSFLSQESCCQNVFIMNVVAMLFSSCSSNCTDANPYTLLPDSRPFLTHAVLGAWKCGAFLGALLCAKGWEIVRMSAAWKFMMPFCSLQVLIACADALALAMPSRWCTVTGRAHQRFRLRCLWCDGTIHCHAISFKFVNHTFHKER